MLLELTGNPASKQSTHMPRPCIPLGPPVSQTGSQLPGVKQGDPLAPVLFAMGFHDLVDELNRKFPALRQLWRLDDGALYGPPKVFTPP